MLGDTKTGGYWAHEELDHINCLELKAILMGLKILCKDNTGIHIRLRSDNATTVACMNRCGSTKPNLHNLIEQIFEWAVEGDYFISSTYRGVT